MGISKEEKGNKSLEESQGNGTKMHVIRITQKLREGRWDREGVVLGGKNVVIGIIMAITKLLVQR